MCDCLICGDEVPEGRAAAGILICLGSGEQAKANVLAISQMRRTG